ncbi:MAG: DUF547 domain-containing protein [Pseudomonadota bacterium]
MSIVPRLATLLVILAFLPAIGSGALFAPKSEPWPRWEAHDPASTARIDHGLWNQFLGARTTAIGNRILFAYSDVTASERAGLDAYLALMSKVRIAGHTRDEQLAFWINLYNAMTVKVVLDHYPVESIRDIDISPGLFSSGPWDADLISVDGVALTLNDIEHRILRPIWNDPRIHYGVNCASMGCPDLAAMAYTGASVDQMLDAAARAFVNDKRGVRIGADGLVVSKIYDWFIDDFGGSEAGVLAHLTRYAVGDLVDRIKAAGAIDDTAYDWRLNDAQARLAAAN